MKKTLLLAMPTLLIAACSQGGGPDQLADGRWEMTMSIDSVDAPGVPEAEKAQLPQSMKTQSASQCVKSSGGDLLQQMRDGLTAGIRAGGGNISCEYSNDDRASGGVLKIQATCRPAGATGQARLAIDGTFGTETLDTTLELNMERSPPGGQPQQVRMKGKMTGRRTGDC